MAFGFGDKKDEKPAAAVNSSSAASPAPAPSAPAAKSDVKTKKARSIPKNVVSQFSEEEKALFSKDAKTLTPDEMKKLTKIKMKIVGLQGRMLQRKLEQKNRVKVSDKKISYAKCIFAEEALLTEEGKRLFRDLSMRVEFSASAVDGLKALAQKHKLDLNFKVKPKAVKKDA